MVIMKKREKTKSELETERLLKTMVIGAALAIIVNLMVALLLPAHFYRINAFMIVFIGIFLILKFSSEYRR